MEKGTFSDKKGEKMNQNEDIEGILKLMIVRAKASNPYTYGTDKLCAFSIKKFGIKRWLNGAFDWSITPEGREYWAEIYNSMPEKDNK